MVHHLLDLHGERALLLAPVPSVGLQQRLFTVEQSVGGDVHDILVDRSHKTLQVPVVPRPHLVEDRCSNRLHCAHSPSAATIAVSTPSPPYTRTMERIVTPRTGSQYHIESRIGSGGFGAVYRAIMTTEGGLERVVALKVLHETQSSGDELKRLRDEARLLTLLSHRAIVNVVDLVQLSIGWTVVMELVEGLDLHELRQMATFPPRPAIEVVEEVASALHEAWTVDRGDGPLRLVHRDIKPANLKLTRSGEVKVLDFGIASGNLVGREAQTATNEVLGTIRYMAPERFEGHSGPKSDIYALGVVLAELLGQRTGGPMHDGRRLQQTLRSVGHLGGQEVAHLVERMLEYDPEKRPTALEVARECRQLAHRVYGPPLVDWSMDLIPELTEERPKQADDPLVGATLTATHRLGPPPRRILPALAAMGALAIVGTIGAFVLGSVVTGSAVWVGTSGPIAPYSLDRMTDLEDIPTDARHVAISANGNQLIYDSAGEIFVHPIGGRARNLTSSDESIASSPVFSPDGERVAFSLAPGTVEIREVDGTRVQSIPTKGLPQDWDEDLLLLIPGPDSELVLIRNGVPQSFAKGKDWRGARWDRLNHRALIAGKDGMLWATDSEPPQAIGHPAWAADLSSDTRSILYSDFDGREARLHVLDGEGEPHQETHLDGRIDSISSARNAPRAALSNRIRRARFRLVALDSDNHTVVEDRVLPLPDDLGAVGLMPSGQELMWVETNKNRSPGSREITWDETIWLGTLDGEKVRPMVRMQSVETSMAGMTADHLTQYVFQELPGRRGRLVAVRLDQPGEPEHLADLAPQLWSSIWVAPDGERVSLTDEDGRMYVLPLDAPITQLPPNPGTTGWSTLGWNHDESGVLGLHEDGRLVVFDAETLKPTPLAENVVDAAAVPGGQYILQREHSMLWLSPETGEEWPIIDMPTEGFVFEPTPDGSSLLVTDVRVSYLTWVADFKRD